MENRIKFTKAQLQVAINTHLEEENGMNDLFSMAVNGLMYGEREAFLGNDTEAGNKGNGYRKLLKAGMGSGLELNVPRDLTQCPLFCCKSRPHQVINCCKLWSDLRVVLLPFIDGCV